MTLTKAIEILTQDINDPGSVDIMDVNEAKKLGKEALKLLIELRTISFHYFSFLLPGETKK